MISKRLAKYVFVCTFLAVLVAPAIAFGAEVTGPTMASAVKTLGAALAMGISAMAAGYAQARIGSAGQGTLVATSANSRTEGSPKLLNRIARMTCSFQVAEERRWLPIHAMWRPDSYFGIWLSIGSKNPVPKEVDHREIAVRMPMMNKVQLLLASEPREPLQPRPLYMVLLVKKDMSIERRRTRDCHNHEEIKWQCQIRARSDQKHGNEEKWRVVAFVTEVSP